MPVIETSVHKASGFKTYFFHTLKVVALHLSDRAYLNLWVWPKYE